MDTKKINLIKLANAVFVNFVKEIKLCKSLAWLKKSMVWCDNEDFWFSCAEVYMEIEPRKMRKSLKILIEKEMGKLKADKDSLTQKYENN